VIQPLENSGPSQLIPYYFSIISDFHEYYYRLFLGLACIPTVSSRSLSSCRFNVVVYGGDRGFLCVVLRKVAGAWNGCRAPVFTDRRGGFYHSFFRSLEGRVNG